MDKKNIVQIHDNYVLETCYVMVKSYDEVTYNICIGNPPDRLTKLYGILVEFKEITLNEIITKLNGIEEFRVCGISSYTLDTIQSYTVDDQSHSCYIIYGKT